MEWLKEHWYYVAGAIVLVWLLARKTSGGLVQTIGPSEGTVLGLAESENELQASLAKQAAEFSLEKLKLESNERLAELSAATQVKLAEITKPADNSLSIAQLQAALNAQELGNQARAINDQNTTQRRSDLLNALSQLGGSIAQALRRSSSSSGSGGSGGSLPNTPPFSNARRAGGSGVPSSLLSALNSFYNPSGWVDYNDTVVGGGLDGLWNNYDSGWDGFWDLGPTVNGDSLTGTVDSYFTPTSYGGGGLNLDETFYDDDFWTAVEG